MSTDHDLVPTTFALVRDAVDHGIALGIEIAEGRTHALAPRLSDERLRRLAAGALRPSAGSLEKQ
jgi:hypothetical protein